MLNKKQEKTVSLFTKYTHLYSTYTDTHTHTHTNTHTHTQPLAKSYKLSQESIDKFPESIWKFSVYLITWVWSAYITHDLDIMFDLGSHWNSKSPTSPTANMCLINVSVP